MRIVPGVLMLLVASLALSPFQPWLLLVAAALAVAAWSANRAFFALMRRKEGLVKMLGAIALHQLYYLYSSAAFVYCLVESKLGK